MNSCALTRIVQIIPLFGFNAMSHFKNLFTLTLSSSEIGRLYINVICTKHKTLDLSGIDLFSDNPQIFEYYISFLLLTLLIYML